MEYNVGDVVKIKDFSWYCAYRTCAYDSILCGTHIFTYAMTEYCGCEMTIVEVDENCYIMSEDGGMYDWNDEMISRLVKTVNINDVTNNYEEWEKTNATFLKRYIEKLISSGELNFSFNAGHNGCFDMVVSMGDKVLTSVGGEINMNPNGYDE